ncbi:PNPOx family protein [Mycobacterium sp. ML4]
MTEQSFAIDVGHPPSALLKAVNPALGFLLGTPLGGSLRTQFMVLHFTGRKSGKQFKLPVSAHVIDGDLYALASAAWKFNFRGGAPAQVVYNGKTNAMRGELVEDRTVTRDLYLRAAQSYDVKRAQRQMGLKFRDNRIPSAEEFSEAIERLKLSAIKFTPAA